MRFLDKVMFAIVQKLKIKMSVDSQRGQYIELNLNR
jgi:hypothetical protein